MQNMPKYVCHKTVSALNIARVILGDPKSFLDPVDKRFPLVEVDEEWMRRHKPKGQGYYVVYEDGYTSWSPVEAFEKGYTLDVPKAADSNTTRANVLGFAPGRSVQGGIDPQLYNEACSRVSELQCVIDQAGAALRKLPSPYPPALADLLIYAGPHPVTRYVYEVPKCGCRGFFHAHACSEQNPLDPFGAIITPEHRERVREMSKRADGSDQMTGFGAPPLTPAEVQGMASLDENARLRGQLEAAEQHVKILQAQGFSPKGNPCPLPHDHFGACVTPEKTSTEPGSCERAPSKWDLEQAFIDIANATDGAGRHITLYRPPLSLGKVYDIDSLRLETQRAASVEVGPGTRFLDMKDDPISQLQGEMAHWRNLALLANALSLAIDAELKANGV